MGGGMCVWRWEVVWRLEGCDGGGGGVLMKEGCEDVGMHGHSRETSKRVWPVFLQLLTSFMW